jgi:protein-disulfide isomerase
MAGPVAVSTAQVEELYQQNAATFALMSPDEAREKLRLDVEGRARLRKYRETIAQLRKASQVDWRLEEPRLPSLNTTNTNASRGPGNARVVVTEYSDFQCPFCKVAQKTIKQVMQDYPDDVRLVFKHLPLEIHPLAFESAQAAFCGGQQGAFWQYHDGLFDSDLLSPEVLTNLAKTLRLDLNQFQKCLASPESRVAVLDNLSEAQQLGLSSTPTFLVNGKVIRGAVSFEEFKGVVESELKNAQAGSHEQ